MLRRAVFLCLIVVAAASQPTRTAEGDALKFFQNYFVTGDYAVGGIGLRGKGVNGIARAAIPFTGVPADADVLAAFVYFQLVVTNQTMHPLAEAKFRGKPIDRVAELLNPQGTTPCWSSGGGTGSSNGAHKLLSYRVDALRFLERELKPTQTTPTNSNPREGVSSTPTPLSSSSHTPSSSLTLVSAIRFRSPRGRAWSSSIARRPILRRSDRSSSTTVATRWIRPTIR